MRLLVLTDRRQSARAGRDLADTVRSAVTAGAPTVLFREKDLPDDERLALGRRVARAAGEADLVVASDLVAAQALGAVAVHLAATDPWPDPPSPLAVGRSCHDAAELADAAAHGAAYATLSPVFPSPSKPGHGPVLGLAGLADLAAGAGLPVVALGGVDASRVRPCLENGADGVAVMGAVMAAPDPAAAVRSLLDQEVVP